MGLAAFKKLHGAFEVIVVSLLAIILILVIEAIQQTSNYRLTASAALHKNYKNQNAVRRRDRPES